MCDITSGIAQIRAALVPYVYQLFCVPGFFFEVSDLLFTFPGTSPDIKWFGLCFSGYFERIGEKGLICRRVSMFCRAVKRRSSI